MKTTLERPPRILLDAAVKLSLRIPEEIPWSRIDFSAPEWTAVGPRIIVQVICERCNPTFDEELLDSWQLISAPLAVCTYTTVDLKCVWPFTDYYAYVGQCQGCLSGYWGVPTDSGP